jgi:hypothetical protein
MNADKDKISRELRDKREWSAVSAENFRRPFPLEATDMG